MVGMDVRNQDKVGLRQPREDRGLGWINHDDLATSFDDQGCMVNRCDLDRAS